MAVEFREQRQSHRFHLMKLLGSHAGKKSGDVMLNVTAMVDMMMVLVIFLVMNFNATGEMLFLSKDMRMSLAEHGSEITRVPIIAVSYADPARCNDVQDPECVPGDGGRSLYFEGQVIADLGSIDMEDPDWLIPELEEKLNDNRQRFEMIGGDRAQQMNPEEDPTSTVNLQIHQATTYKLVKRVLYTCEKAGYGRIRLTVGDGRSSGPAEGEEGEAEE
jgi:biopolymer transport protein ExbD